MTIDECIKVLQDIKNGHPDQAADMKVCLKAKVHGAKTENLLLCIRRPGGENSIVLEEKVYGDQPGLQLIKRIKSVIRRYFETDPWTEKTSAEFDSDFTPQEAIDEIVDILK